MGRLRDRAFAAVALLCAAALLCFAAVSAFAAPLPSAGDDRLYEGTSSTTAQTKVELWVVTDLAAQMTPEFAMSESEIKGSRAQLTVYVSGGVGDISFAWERVKLDANGNPGTPESLSTTDVSHPLYADSFEDDAAYIYTCTVTDENGSEVKVSTKVVVADGYQERTLPSEVDVPRVHGFSVHEDAVFADATHAAGSSAYAALRQAAAGKAMDATAYQAALTLPTGIDAPFGPFVGSLEVTLPVADADAAEVYVVGVTSTGKVVEFGPLEVVDGTVTFVTPELGVFAVAYATTAEDMVSVTAIAGAGGTIDPAGTTSYAKGSSAVYTLLPNDGYVLSALYVDGDGTEDNLGTDVTPAVVGNTYTFSGLSADHTIHAVFEEVTPDPDVTHSLTAQVGANSEGGTFGKVRIDGYTAEGAEGETDTATVTHGETVQVTFLPDAGYIVGSVTVNGEPAATFGNYFRISAMTADTVVTVIFEQGTPAPVPSHEVTAEVTAGRGSATPEVQVIPHAGRAAVTVTPEAGWKIKTLTIDGVDAKGQIADMAAGGTITLENVIADRAVEVAFQRISDTYVITAQAGSGGSITPSGAVEVPLGQPVTFTFTADAGYQLARLLVDGVGIAFGELFTPNEDGNFVGPYEYTFDTVEDNATIRVEFEALPLEPAEPTYATVSVIAGEGGRVTPAGDVRVDLGGSLSIALIPDDGNVVDAVTVGGVAVDPAEYLSTGVLALSDIQADTVVSVTFRAKTDADPDPVIPTLYTVTASASTGGSISPSGAVEYAKGADASFVITADAGYYLGNLIVDGRDVAVSGALSAAGGTHTFTGLSASHTIHAEFLAEDVPPDAPDYVTVNLSSGANGDLSPEGDVRVEYGAAFMVSILPDPGYVLDVLTVDGAFIALPATATSYTLFDLTADAEVHATFRLPDEGETPVTPAVHTVTVSSTGMGTVSPAGAVQVASGGSLLVTFLPDEGYEVTRVVVGDSSGNKTEMANLVGASSYRLTDIAEDMTVEVTFNPKPLDPSIPSQSHYTVTSAVVGAGGSISPVGPVTVEAGKSATFSVIPEAGYLTYGVRVFETGNPPADDAGWVAFGGTSYTLFDVSADMTIQVRFAADPDYNPDDSDAPVTFDVSVTSGAGGTVSPSGTTQVVEGGSLLITLLPEDGNVVDVVEVSTDGGDTWEKAQVGGTSFRLTDISGDTLVRVSFKMDEGEGPGGEQPGPAYATVHATAGPNGSISPSGDYRMEIGESQTFLFTPAAGYVVDQVLYDGAPVTPIDSSYTIFDIQVDHTLHVTFREAGEDDDDPVLPETFDIAAYASTGGSVWPSGVTKVAAGGSLLLRWAPDAGFEVDTVTVDGTALPAADAAAGQYRFSNVAENHSIYVTFKASEPEPPEPEHFTVSASASYGGAISPAGDIKVVAGGSVTFSLLPDQGYRVKSLSIDGGTPFAFGGSTYTLFDIQADHTIHVEFEATGDPDTPRPVTHEVTAIAGAGGSISPSGAIEVVEGASIAFAFLPDAGYEVDSVTVTDSDGKRTTYQAGDPAIAGGQYRFASVMGDCSISVTFKQAGTVDPGPGGEAPDYPDEGDVFKVTADASEGGSILPSGIIEVKAGENVAFAVEPHEGYKLGKLLVNGVDMTELVAGGVFVLENVQADTLVYAEFVPDEGAREYVIDAWVTGGHGIVSPSGKVKVAEGADITFYFYPDSGYQVAWIKVDGKKVGFTAASYAFANVAADHTLEVAFEPLVPPGGIGQTGDGAPIGVLVALLVASGAVLVALYLRRRQEG